LLRDLAKYHNKIILFSSHDWRLAKEFADKIWFINDQNLQEGLAEDILLKNDLLTNPRLFTINEEFVSPEIIAPFLEKEMLYSALQKNFKRDLSGFKIEFQGAFWEIFYQNNRFSCQSIDEILLSIRNCL
jgi:iron complex transport system ATP-binding protein